MRKKARQGFTLLEVMISLAISGGLLVVLLYSISFHLSMVATQEAQTVATMLCKQKLDDLKDKPTASEGSFPEPYSEYKYRTSVTPSSYDGLTVLGASVRNGATEITLREIVRTGALSE